MKINKDLNPEQIKAIRHDDGPLLIIAGAGTGKTTVITERIKYFILEKNIPPANILALTFTDKAAQEMEERVDIAIPYGYTQMWIYTFHAFCDRILRDEAIHIGLNPRYKLMTQAQTVLFLRKNLFKLKLDYFKPLGNPAKFLEGLIQHFERLRDEDIDPEEYIRFANKMSNETSDNNEIKKTFELTQAFKIFDKLKIEEGCMDFSDLITNVLKLFRKRPNVLKYYQDKFTYILVDEFQDTNYAQNQLALLLAGKNNNIAVVGDDDQAIYRWRGAAISNIIQFKKRYPKATVVTLTKNYRSTQEILDRSYRLIQNNNPDRLEVKEKVSKKLKATRNVRGHFVELLFVNRVEDEADLVVKKIQELVASDLEYKDIAILVRANDHSQPFVRALERHNIPYQFLGPGKLFHQEEIKDLISYLKVLYNFDDSTSLYRVLNLSIFQLETRDIASLLNFARRKNISLFNAMEKILSLNEDELSEIFLLSETKEKIDFIVSMIKKHLKSVPTETAGQILYYFLQDSGFLQKLVSAKTAITEKQYQNIARFFDKLKTFESQQEIADVFSVVDWIDLSMQLGESPMSSEVDWTNTNAVNILTIHSSKGLEFSAVFLVNLINQRFPTRERKEQIPIPKALIKEILPEGDFHLQEERRLFYVGATRAKDYLHFTAARYYGEEKRERKLSPFVYEALGENIVEKILNQHKSKQTIVQPTLLEWAEKQLKETPFEKMHETPKIIPYRINYISYSQLNCYDLCPMHYKLRYILKIPSFPTPSQSFGTSIHSALRDFYQSWIKNHALDIDSVENILMKVWIDEGYENKDHEKEALERGKFLLKTYLSKYHNLYNKNKEPIACEVPFQFSLKNPENGRLLKIGGRIDRIDKVDNNHLEILDYKTGRNVPDEKDLSKDLQLTFYALAATQVHDNLFNKKPEEIILSLYYIEEDKKLSTTRTVKQLEEAKLLIFKKIEEIENSTFVCNGNMFCKNCEYKMLCLTNI